MYVITIQIVPCTVHLLVFLVWRNVGRENGNLGQGNCSCCNCQSNSKTHLIFFLFQSDRALSRSLYVSLSISVSRSFSPFKTNHKYLRMRDCAFQGYRYTQTHTIHWHTGAPDSAVCFAANCLYSADYSSHWMYLFVHPAIFVCFCSARANLQRTRSREFAQSLFPVCIFYWPQFASFHALFESQKDASPAAFRELFSVG